MLEILFGLGNVVEMNGVLIREVKNRGGSRICKRGAEIQKGGRVADITRK